MGDPEFVAVISSLNLSASGNYAAYEWGRWNFEGLIQSDWCDGREIGGWVDPWYVGSWWNTQQCKTLVFNWLEEDGGATAEWNIGATYKVGDNNITTGFKVTLNANDDKIGTITVDYDSPNRSFNTPAVKMALFY